MSSCASRLKPMANVAELVLEVSAHLRARGGLGAARRPLAVVGAASGLAVLLLFAVTASSAQAGLSKYPKAAFTKGTTSTYWFHWVEPSGGSSKVCLFFYEGAKLVSEPGCTKELPGPFEENIFYTEPGLTSGHEYGMCAEEYKEMFPLGNSQCVDTTMDAATPTVVAYVDGTATYTNNPVLALHLDYSSPVAPPWPWTVGCTSKGSNPCTPSSYIEACSNENVPGSATNSFDCTDDVSSVPNHDGQWWFCAYEPDAAVPDNPTSPSQSGSPTQANLSNVSCGDVILDTTPPVEAPTTASTNVTVGQLVNFTASSTDSGSGVDPNAYSWNFGDNTPAASGGTASHTYTQAGTYKVTLSGKDNAGNAGTGYVTMTVNAQSGGGGGGGGASTTGGATTTNRGGTGTNGGTKAACHVPKLVGQKLAAARSALVRAHCKVGKVTKRHTLRRKRGKVLSQSLSAGARRAAGTPINLVVGR